MIKSIVVAAGEYPDLVIEDLATQAVLVVNAP
jgi:hypothetical protein